MSKSKSWRKRAREAAKAWARCETNQEAETMVEAAYLAGFEDAVRVAKQYPGEITRVAYNAALVNMRDESDEEWKRAGRKIVDKIAVAIRASVKEGKP